MNRRRFLAWSLQSVAGSMSLVLLSSCSEMEGRGANLTPPPSEKAEGNCLFRGTWVYVQPLHTPNHVVNVTAYDIDQAVEQTYVLEDNDSGHTHTVVLTPEDFRLLQDNQSVMKMSSVTNGHAHTVRIDCV